MTSLSSTVWPQRAVLEMAGLLMRDGVRGFHVRADASTMSCAGNFGKELMRKGLDVRFAWESIAGSTSDGRISTLQAAGCRVACYGIPSGSQRLLDLCTGGGVSVSSVIQELRACSAAGLLTTARLTYPLQDDDYHTTCETLRMLEYGRVDAAVIEMPEHAQSDLSTLRMLGLDWPRLPEPGARGRKGAWRGSRLHDGDSQIWNDTLRAELETRGVLTSLSPELLLAAQVSGFEGREPAFAERLHMGLALGHLEVLEELIAEVNRHSVAPSANTIAFRPFAAQRNVVGN